MTMKRPLKPIPKSAMRKYIGRVNAIRADFRRQVQALAKEVRRDVVLPACRQLGLNFSAGMFFLKDGPRGEPIENNMDAVHAGLGGESGLDQVFKVLHLLLTDNDELFGEYVKDVWLPRAMAAEASVARQKPGAGPKRKRARAKGLMETAALRTKRCLVISPRRGGFEIRPWENGRATHGATIVASLEEAQRSALDIGYVNLGRLPDDAPAIIEIWSAPTSKDREGGTP